MIRLALILAAAALAPLPTHIAAVVSTMDAQAAAFAETLK
jgi:hypothetical protein